MRNGCPRGWVEPPRAAGKGNGRDGSSSSSRVRAARAGVDAAARHGARGDDDDDDDPGSPIGPYHWGDLDASFSVCGTGTNQSPVNIETAQVGVLHGPPLLLRYEASELAIENTGHVVEVMIPAGVNDVLQIGGDKYMLTQYHFHAPSEHIVNGVHADGGCCFGRRRSWRTARSPHGTA
jgi:Eukaryotic-type carbonic anhydrase